MVIVSMNILREMTVLRFIVSFSAQSLKSIFVVKLVHFSGTQNILNPSPQVSSHLILRVLRLVHKYCWQSIVRLEIVKQSWWNFCSIYVFSSYFPDFHKPYPHKRAFNTATMKKLWVVLVRLNVSRKSKVTSENRRTQSLSMFRRAFRTNGM